MTLHSWLPPEAYKDRITTKTQRAGGMKTSLPEVHGRAFTGRVTEHYNGREKTVRKTSWQNRLWKKHPILSGVEICRKHIPRPIVILRYFNIGKYCMCLRCWDAAPKHHTSVAGHNAALVLGDEKGQYK